MRKHPADDGVSLRPLIATFTIGNLSGIMRLAPVDLQQTDSYFVVAHFHYVLSGAACWALRGHRLLVAKITGRL